MTKEPGRYALMHANGATWGEVLNAYAHELAEEIRTHWYPKFPGESEYTQGVDDGYAKAANLIDPRVEK